MRIHPILSSLAVATPSLPVVLPRYRLHAIMSTCTDLMIPITAIANNTLMPAYPNSTSSIAFYDYLKSLTNADIQPNMHTASGTYNISARFWKPTVQVHGREDSIQVFLHGLTGNNPYWSGLDYPSPPFPEEHSSV
ncbi:hypothetical protein BDZ45DRAFT_802437 [Acephala macrosclerotiorum]|nr:hypothetical protein BDZ45DRAFT_802437 [Acephala macrosclerotiorum]